MPDEPDTFMREACQTHQLTGISLMLQPNYSMGFSAYLHKDDECWIGSGSTVAEAVSSAVSDMESSASKEETAA